MTTPDPRPRGTGPFGAGTDLGAAFDLATQVKPLVVAVGDQVVPLVDPARGGQLHGQFAPARERIALALGFVMPSVTLRGDAELRPDAYAIRVRGVTVAQGTARPGRWLAVVGQGSDWAAVSPGEPTSDPATGRAAYWIGEEDVRRARAMGHIVLDPTAAMVAHLEAVVRANAWRLIDRDHVRAQLEALCARDPRLAAAVARRFDPGLLTRVLRRLLAEGVSIRDFQAVLDALDETPPGVRASLALAEHVRRRLAPAICRGVAPDGVLHVVDLRAWERLALRRADAALRPGPAYPLGPLAGRALAALRDRVLAAGTPGQVAVVRAPARLRPHLGVMLAAGPGPVAVLAAEEVPPEFTVLKAAPPQLPPGVAARNMVRRWRVRGQLGRAWLAEGLGWFVALGGLVRELPAALGERGATERAARVEALAREAAGVRDQYGGDAVVVVLGPAQLAAAGAATSPLAWLEAQPPALIQALLLPLPDDDVSWLLDALPAETRATALRRFAPDRQALLGRIWEDRRGDFSSARLEEATQALLARLGLDGPAAPAPAPVDPRPAWPDTGAAADELAPAIAGRDRRPEPEPELEPAPEPEPEPDPADLAMIELHDPERVAAMLLLQPPAPAAGVLAALNPGYADMVLSVMPPDLQEDLINRLMAGAVTDANALQAFARTLLDLPPAPPPGDGPFGFLEQLDPELVADLLAQERPGTAAGVLAALNPGYADMVLMVLAPEVQEDLINRLQTSPPLPGFQARQVAAALRRRLGVPA